MCSYARDQVAGQTAGETSFDGLEVSNGGSVALVKGSRQFELHDGSGLVDRIEIGVGISDLVHSDERAIEVDVEGVKTLEGLFHEQCPVPKPLHEG